jgi:methionine synthase II (cobalamin-independent)
MALPTEPIGSIPRPEELIAGLRAHRRGDLGQNALDRVYDRALRATVGAFEDTGSPVITDGEQAKPSFLTYPIDEADNVEPDGVQIPFEAGYTRTLPRLTEGPLHHETYAVEYLPPEQPGTTDDCGFSPFGDDRSTARRTAFRKIEARGEGTRMARKAVGLADRVIPPRPAPLAGAGGGRRSCRCS